MKPLAASITLCFLSCVLLTTGCGPSKGTSVPSKERLDQINQALAEEAEKMEAAARKEAEENGEEFDTE